MLASGRTSSATDPNELAAVDASREARITPHRQRRGEHEVHAAALLQRARHAEQALRRHPGEHEQDEHGAGGRSGMAQLRLQPRQQHHDPPRHEVQHDDAAEADAPRGQRRQPAEHVEEPAPAERQVMRGEPQQRTGSRLHAACAPCPVTARNTSSSEELPRPALRFQLGQRAFGDQAAVVEDADAVGQALGDLEDVRGEDDGGAGPHARREQVLHLAGDGRIEPGQRLVEHDQRGSWIRAPASATFCFMPREKPSQRAWRCGVSSRMSSSSSALRSARAALDAPQAGDELEVLERRELVVEHGLVGQPRRDALGGDRIGQRIDAEDLDAAGIRRQQARRPCAGWWSCRRRSGPAGRRARRRAP